MPARVVDDAQDVADEQIAWWMGNGILAKQAIGWLRPDWSVFATWDWNDVAMALKSDWRRMKRGD